MWALADSTMAQIECIGDGAHRFDTDEIAGRRGEDDGHGIARSESDMNACPIARKRKPRISFAITHQVGIHFIKLYIPHLHTTWISRRARPGRNAFVVKGVMLSRADL